MKKISLCIFPLLSCSLYTHACPFWKTLRPTLGVIGVANIIFSYWS